MFNNMKLCRIATDTGYFVRFSTYGILTTEDEQHARKLSKRDAKKIRRKLKHMKYRAQIEER